MVRKKTVPNCEFVHDQKNKIIKAIIPVETFHIEFNEFQPESEFFKIYQYIEEYNEKVD